MKPKKNPKKDLSKNSSIYFAFGMMLVLGLTYATLEWKTFYGQEYTNTAMNLEDDLIEQVPITFVTPPPPPPPAVAPAVIEVVEDILDIKEVLMASTESNEEEEVMEVKDVEYHEVEEEVHVIWTNIEEVPVFPGCENDTDKRACFNKMMKKHISKIFRYPGISQEMGVQGKVYTQFTIQKDGTIGNVLLRGPDKNLEKEAKRIIDKLPKMKPGKQRDKNVKVAFTIPITFKLNN